MIKRYLEFINESIEEIEKDYNSFGEWVEKLAQKDDYILNMVSDHIKDFDPTIRIANAVNLLDESTKEFIYDMITKYQEEEQGDISVDTYVPLKENVDSKKTPESGKNMFKSFLKVLTALGYKDIKPVWEKMPDSFLTLFKSPMMDIKNLKEVFVRYKFFDEFLNKINYSNNECLLYFGIKNDLVFEYGLSSETERVVIGKFPINQSTINWILLLDSSSSANLKRMMVGYNYKNIQVISKLRSKVNAYKKPEYFTIEDDIVRLGFYGEGKWDSGKMDPSSLEAFKQEFIQFMIKSKLSNNFKMNVTTDKFWVYVNLKINK
ncbi:hypothetical protein EBU94_06785 [bacterium]|nr:hypothetical protein [bacterium]